MRRGLILLKMYLAVAVMLIATGLLLIQLRTNIGASAAALQNPGGGIQPVRTPTPAPNKGRQGKKRAPRPKPPTAPKPMATPTPAQTPEPTPTSTPAQTPAPTPTLSPTPKLTPTPLSKPMPTPAPQPGTVMQNKIGMEFVWIAPGSFMMGSLNGEADEKPEHRVTISKGFYMGEHEVTIAEWRALMKDTDRMKKLERKFKESTKQPVVRVSWKEAHDFIDKLNKLGDGYMYRLPTEAEWEYACRAGTTGDYAGELDAMGWYDANSGGRTNPVRQMLPNEFKLYDMHGNVWEWCQDWYHENYNGAPTDGSAWESGGEQINRVLRGGGWSYHAIYLRSAQRRGHKPGYESRNIGFRVVAVALK